MCAEMAIVKFWLFSVFAFSLLVMWISVCVSTSLCVCVCVAKAAGLNTIKRNVGLSEQKVACTWLLLLSCISLGFYFFSLSHSLPLPHSLVVVFVASAGSWNALQSVIHRSGFGASNNSAVEIGNKTNYRYGSSCSLFSYSVCVRAWVWLCVCILLLMLKRYIAMYVYAQWHRHRLIFIITVCTLNEDAKEVERLLLAQVNQRLPRTNSKNKKKKEKRSRRRERKKYNV